MLRVQALVQAMAMVRAMVKVMVKVMTVEIPGTLRLLCRCPLHRGGSRLGIHPVHLHLHPVVATPGQCCHRSDDLAGPVHPAPVDGC